MNFNTENPPTSSKDDKDESQVTNEAETDNDGASANPVSGSPTKNPAAVALGRLGGLKGGKARALSLTKNERREAARKAAWARWQKYDSTE